MPRTYTFHQGDPETAWFEGTMAHFEDAYGGVGGSEDAVLAFAAQEGASVTITEDDVVVREVEGPPAPQHFTQVLYTLLERNAGALSLDGLALQNGRLYVAVAGAGAELVVTVAEDHSAAATPAQPASPTEALDDLIVAVDWEAIYIANESKDPEIKRRAGIMLAAANKARQLRPPTARPRPN